MKEQGREKPKSVEVGQRWKNDCGMIGVVVNVGPSSVQFDWGGSKTYWPISAILSACTYLGGPSPSPEGAGRVMEAEYGSGKPARCLNCGLDKQGCAYMCNRADCLKLCDDGRYDKLTADWDRGARDFPRSPAPVPVARKPSAVECTFTYGGQHCQMLNEHQDHICGADPGFRIPVAAAEREAAMVRPHDGTVSALQAIQSRPKPEPYVCPVDDWDLLPDAGT